jgi:hypothetical protein
MWIHLGAFLPVIEAVVRWTARHGGSVAGVEYGEQFTAVQQLLTPSDQHTVSVGNAKLLRPPFDTCPRRGRRAVSGGPICGFEDHRRRISWCDGEV